MKNTRILLAFLLLLCVVMTSCKRYSGFKHDSKGFHYKFHQLNEKNPKPETGDFVVVNMGLRTDDAVITPMTQTNMLIDELYRGDIYCALRSMHLEDSATFIFNGRKFYEKFLGMGDYPYGKSPIYADIKLLKIMSKENLEKAKEMYDEHMQQIRRREDSLVWDYVDQHFLDSVCHGIHFTYNLKGEGPKPLSGQTVEILYRGHRIDQSVFDSRMDPTNPLVVELGKSLLPYGMEVMLLNMCVGDRITMILPSSAAFGAKGNTEFRIDPYSPVIYELELLGIK